MNIDEALSVMVPPGQRRPGKCGGMDGVMQIHLTRACDLACSNCTQGSQFAGRASYITLENFELACQSMEGYFGLIGIFGGNPAMHPKFIDICAILRNYFPKEKCGVWSNNPVSMSNARAMRETFSPAHSNLNCHMSVEAYHKFKDFWPESRPFGHDRDSLHSPVHGDLALQVPDASDRWKLISECDINKHWSAMICQFRDELRGFFCEVAGGQAMINQFDPSYPDTGMVVTPGWWKAPMQVEPFRNQVAYHCQRCLVPLRGKGDLAHTDDRTTVVDDGSYSHLKPKIGHTLNILTPDDMNQSEPDVVSKRNASRRVIDYLLSTDLRPHRISKEYRDEPTSDAAST
jgi:hypothetical protein